MNNFKRYNIVLLLVIAILVSMLFSIALYMRPTEGDLTRLGGYLSNGFGSNEYSLKFSEPLFKLADNLDDYNRYYDIVVIGDSFSKNLDYGWQNYLVMKSGLSIITFDIQKVSIDDIVSSQAYNDYPPRVFLYESIEYAVWLRNSTCDNKGPVVTNASMQSDALSLKPIPVKLIKAEPSLPAYISGDIDFDAAANYFYKSIFRNIFRINITEVEKMRLISSDFFSNRASDKILLHYKDFTKSSLTQRMIEDSVCSLHDKKHKIESNEYTSFVFFPVPDKLSSYGRYLFNSEYSDISIISKYDNKDLNLIRVDECIRTALDYGVVDLYRPDDTHWSYKGHELAASSVLDYFIQISILKIY